jgi:hypothetical protein
MARAPLRDRTGAWVLAGAFAIDCLSLRPRVARALEVEWRIEHAGNFVDAAERAAAHDAGDLFEFEVGVGGKSSGGRGAWNRYWVHALLAGELAERFRRYFSRVSEEAARPSAEALLDLKLIAELPGLDAVKFVLAAFWIFRMHREEIPMGLPSPREEWVECYWELAEPTGASADLDDDYADVAALLDPILSGEVERGTWDPSERRWTIP